MSGVWPLQDLRLSTPDLALSVMTEADLPSVCDALPDDVELDPAATRYAAVDEATNRRVIIAQGYWGALGTWSPESWMLPFVVRREGGVVGVQWLEGPDFATHRLVDSSSWLVPDGRGRGFGKQMRAAVLELAFSHLGARVAVSSAVVGNAASLGVSRSLGYVETHTSVLEHSGEELQHLRLEADAWRRSGRGRAVDVEGIELALPYFGLDGQASPA